MSPLYKGKSLPVPDVEEADSFSVQREEYLFLHKAESVPLLYVVGADSFSIHGKDCLLYTWEKLSFCHIVEGAHSLSRKRRESLRCTDDRSTLDAR